MRCLYVDLDGTLLGPDASLLTGADGRFSLLGARALEACARAGAEVVIYSGRRQSSVFDAARLIGSSAFIFEIGCGLVIDGELEWLTDGVEPSESAGSIFDQIEASGAPAMLLETFAGRLEYHTPWATGREVSHLFRGEIDLAAAAAALDAAGFGWLRIVDNGVIDVASDRLSAVTAMHAITWFPPAPPRRGRSPATSRHAGMRPQDCIAVGDSREDMGQPRSSGRSGWSPTRSSATRHCPRT